ncbi:MAG: glutathione S-transferase N-terminal domain-containing protein [Acidobacteria bacterium]|nr:glutathione S-transferase N-terminal domain-containing protein [Acidobacteriota bacterium]
MVLYVGEKNMSSWSMRPYVALVEKEIPFDEKTVLIREDKDRARRRALSPTGKVPVLQHGDLMIPDSLAIIEYLEETFPPPKHKPLWPADTRQRAHARWLAAAMHAGFAKLRESMSFNLCFLETVPPATPDAVAEAKEVLSYWESALDAKTGRGPFLFGSFGAVDAMYAPVVVRLTAFKVDTAHTPKSAAYMKSVLAHPPVKRWMDAARALPPVAAY